VFGRFKYLQDLDLSDNNVTVIPNTNRSSFSSLANLNKLMLASCTMNKVPDLRNLPRTLDLLGNLLKGEIPIWIWNPGKRLLGSLKGSQNKLSSLRKPYTFPFTLNVLDLSSNKLKGDIMVPPTGIYVVNYSNNEFGSSILADFGNALTSAFSFSISNSKLVGFIPESINNVDSFVL
nr:hypothetical protein [Tanacetum cinerariifolium]